MKAIMSLQIIAVRSTHSYQLGSTVSVKTSTQIAFATDVDSHCSVKSHRKYLLHLAIGIASSISSDKLDRRALAM